MHFVNIALHFLYVLRYFSNKGVVQKVLNSVKIKIKTYCWDLNQKTQNEYLQTKPMIEMMDALNKNCMSFVSLQF